MSPPTSPATLRRTTATACCSVSPATRGSRAQSSRSWPTPSSPAGAIRWSSSASCPAWLRSRRSRRRPAAALAGGRPGGRGGGRRGGPPAGRPGRRPLPRRRLDRPRGLARRRGDLERRRRGGGRPAEAGSGGRMNGDAFAGCRPRLLGIAYGLLGELTEAEDVVQDAWLRWDRADRYDLRSAEAFLVTVTTRLALDRLRSARMRREVYVGPWLPEPLLSDPRTPETRVIEAE